MREWEEKKKQNKIYFMLNYFVFVTCFKIEQDMVEKQKKN